MFPLIMFTDTPPTFDVGVHGRKERTKGGQLSIFRRAAAESGEQLRIFRRAVEPIHDDHGSGKIGQER
ncbi:hypothetical protein Tco_1464678 [Tanacetum coccineum]